MIEVSRASGAWSLEDDLGRVTYAVRGDTFFALTTIWSPRGERADTDVELRDLRLDREPNTQRFIATAVGDRAVLDEELELRAQRAGDARVAAIDDGASFDLGEPFDAARSALRARIHAYADELAADLLRTLLALAGARVSTAAIAACAYGCLHACFQHVPDAEVQAIPTPMPS